MAKMPERTAFPRNRRRLVVTCCREAEGHDVTKMATWAGADCAPRRGNRQLQCEHDPADGPPPPLHRGRAARLEGKSRSCSSPALPSRAGAAPRESPLSLPSLHWKKWLAHQGIFIIFFVRKLCLKTYNWTCKVWLFLLLIHHLLLRSCPELHLVPCSLKSGIFDTLGPVNVKRNCMATQWGQLYAKADNDCGRILVRAKISSLTVNLTLLSFLSKSIVNAMFI